MINLNLHALLEICLRTFIIYAIILVGVRLTGKREIGQLTPFDLVFLLLISNSVQNAMTGPDTSLTGGLVAAVTLFVATFIVSRLFFKDRKLRQVIEGSPTVLISHGEVFHPNLDKENLTVDQLSAALREHGVLRAEDVELAVLEIDGSISIIRKDDFKEGVHPRMHRGFRYLKDKT